ncbi:MAG TPA: hypothetical protein VLH10_23305 [Yinghuangia sp.]|nr:hypothetical protein [Yinghuangia sp.]
MGLIVLVVIVVGAAGALVYRRPRWTGGLTMCVRREAEPGYQVAGVLVRGRFGRTMVHGQDDDPYVLRLPHTTARVTVRARRSWRHPREVDLLVRVRLADPGRQDTVRCPVGGRRMVLGLDVRHDTAPLPPAPPRPPVPPPPAPESYPPNLPLRDAPTMVHPFPPPTSSPEQAPTVMLPPPGGPRPPNTHGGGLYPGGELSGGPDTGGPRRWPPT